MIRCYLVICSLLMIATSCEQPSSVVNDNSPKAISLKTFMNFYGKVKDKIVSQVFSDSTTIISYDGYYIYKKSVIVTVDTVFMRADSTIVREKTGRVDTIQRCYVYKENEQSGWIVNALDTVAAGRFPVDSFLKANAYNNVEVNDYFISSAEFSADGTREYYTPKAKKNANTPDSIILSYQTNMSHIAFYSFSFDLEKKKKQKLVSTKYILNATAQMPEQEITATIAEVPVTDVNVLRKLTGLVNGFYERKKT